MFRVYRISGKNIFRDKKYLIAQKIERDRWHGGGGEDAASITAHAQALVGGFKTNHVEEFKI